MHGRKVALVCVSALLALGPAKAAGNEGRLAELQRELIWQAMASDEQFEGVDQIVIEGEGTGPIVSGWLEKRGLVMREPTDLWRPFWSRIERPCLELEPKCFRLMGMWSRGEKLLGN